MEGREFLGRMEVVRARIENNGGSLGVTESREALSWVMEAYLKWARTAEAVAEARR